MAATSDEEMDSLLSGFDQIYKVMSSCPPSHSFSDAVLNLITVHLRLASGKWGKKPK